MKKKQAKKLAASGGGRESQRTVRYLPIPGRYPKDRDLAGGTPKRSGVSKGVGCGLWAACRRVGAISERAPPIDAPLLSGLDMIYE
jgi:hypothetical protein